MKKILKYSIFIAFAIMLHSTIMGAMKASEILCISNTTTRKEVGCFISQERTANQLVRVFYAYYANLTCDTDHSGPSYTPTNKSIVLLLKYFNKHKLNIIFGNVSSHSLSYNLADPINYYIYGLRKIVV